MQSHFHICADYSINIFVHSCAFSHSSSINLPCFSGSVPIVLPEDTLGHSFYVRSLYLSMLHKYFFLFSQLLCLLCFVSESSFYFYWFHSPNSSVFLTFGIHPHLVILAAHKPCHNQWLMSLTLLLGFKSVQFACLLIFWLSLFHLCWLCCQSNVFISFHPSIFPIQGIYQTQPVFFLYFIIFFTPSDYHYNFYKLNNDLLRHVLITT